MKNRFLNRLIGRLDRIDTNNLQTQFLRLVQEKGLLETIFHSIQEGIIVLDGRKRVTYANRAAETLLGFAADDAEGEPIAKILRGVDWDLILDLDAKEWSHLVGREIEIRYPDHRYLDFYVVPLKLVNAEEDGAVVLLRDITRDREHAEQNLESERMRALTLLAAGVAHELGNPLNSLNIHLQLLERELKSVPEAQVKIGDLLDVSRREVVRLDTIIRQFLRAIRPTQPQFETATLTDLVRDCLQFMEPEIKDRGVRVTVQTEHDLPAVQVDVTQMKQVFFNLIKNAIQAMSADGALNIALASNDRFAIVTFQDNGTGLSQETMGRIFEPYFTTKGDGSGLGLMIVQRILRDHGGEFEVRSVPGQGTVFKLFLPRENQRVRLLQEYNAPAAGEAP